MKKKLLVAAVASLAVAPVFAQSNVKIYGIVDSGIGYGKAGDTTFNGVVSGPYSAPRIGFKGSEDLGGGLKAEFALEQGFSIDTGAPASATRQFHRQSWVGLSGDFGSVALGRQYAPGYNYSLKFSQAVPGATFNSQAFLTNSIPGASIQPGTDARWDNSITYKLPKMGAFSAEAIYSFQTAESGDDRGHDDRMGVAAAYAAGPVTVGAIYHNSRRAKDNLKEVYLGGTMDFGVAKLSASYQTAKENGVVDAQVAYLGVVVPVGKGRIHADIGRLSDDENADNDSTSLSLAYTYGLSKRTTVYVMANRTTNDDNAARGVLATDDGAASTSLAAGLRHTF